MRVGVKTSFLLPSSSLFVGQTQLPIAQPIGLNSADRLETKGLLGFAFSPSFSSTGLFYVSYTIPGELVSCRCCCWCAFWWGWCFFFPCHEGCVPCYFAVADSCLGD